MLHLILAFTISLVLSLPVLDDPLTLKVRDDTYIVQIGKALPRDASSQSCNIETCTVQKISGGVCSCFGDVSTSYSIEGDEFTVYTVSTIDSTKQSIVHVHCGKSTEIALVDGPIPEFEIRSPHGCKLGAEANDENSTNETEEEEEEEGNSTTPEEEEEENSPTPEEEEEEGGGGNSTTPEEEEEGGGGGGNSTTPEEEEEEGNSTNPEEEEEEEGNSTNPECSPDQELKDGRCVEKSKKPNKLSIGAIVGIVVGAVVAVLIVIIVIACCIKGRNKKTGGEYSQLIPK